MTGTGDPLRESAHRRLHIAEGNFAEALRQYRTYRQLGRAELPPSPQFRALVAPLPGCPLDRSA